MKKSFKYLFLFLIGVLWIPVSVHAEGTELTYRTTITNWKPNNSLYINASDTIPANVTSSWTLICSNEDFDTEIPLSVSSGSVFAGVGDTCDYAVFVETLDFSGMTLTVDDLGLHDSDLIQPSVFDENLSFVPFAEGIAYSFGSYNPTSYSVTYYALNEVDDEGNIIGAPYIRDVYFSYGDGEKTTEQELGSITIPNYAARFSLQVKGNIANPNGTFAVDFADSGKDSILHGYQLGEENVIVVPLDDSEVGVMYSSPSSLLNISYSAGDDNTYLIEGLEGAADPDGIGDSITIGGNTFYLDYTVSASLNAEGSDTGLFYNVWPFVIVLLFGGAFIGLFFFKKKKDKAVVIVDKEVL